jgi:alpha-galactosidase/6-phospho-beta-glucosidase family protein
MPTTLSLTGGMFNRMRNRLSKINYKGLLKRFIPKRFNKEQKEREELKKQRLNEQLKELKMHFIKQKENTNKYYTEQINSKTINNIKKNGYYAQKIQNNNTPKKIKEERNRTKNIINSQRIQPQNFNSLKSSKNFHNTVHMINSIPIPIISLHPKITNGGKKYKSNK